jgi:hypothetical protein
MAFDQHLTRADSSEPSGLRRWLDRLVGVIGPAFGIRTLVPVPVRVRRRGRRG